MDYEEQKVIVNDILKQRRLPYSIELVDVQGDKYIVKNTFGTTNTYIKIGENYLLEEEL